MRRGSRAGLSRFGMEGVSWGGDMYEDSGCAGYDEGGPGIRRRSAAVVIIILSPIGFNGGSTLVDH